MSIIRPYQHEFITNIAIALKANGSVVAALPTGGGKTVCFSEICNRYIQKTDKDVLVLVHREELMNQAYQTLYEDHNIIAELITPKNKNPQPARVYIGMVETVNNRLKKNPDYFRNVGLALPDEAHLSTFKKVIAFMKDKNVIGFSATPIAATKKDPMKNHYKSIVCGPQISELIQMGFLVPVLTYVPMNGIRQSLHAGSGPDGFDQSEMAATYSTTRHVQNTVDKYKLHGQGKKALVFNCNIEHSILVCKAFMDGGYDARHLDSEKSTPEYRKETLEWFKNTAGAILCNIGILTTGFDEPTIECIIINKATKSLPLYLQMGGRGGRICPEIEKKFFIMIDMGNNVIEHLEWSDDKDWEWEFNNPGIPKKKDSGVAPIKICCNEQCEMIIPIQSTICKYCGTIQPFQEPTYDQRLGDFVLITKSIDVAKMVSDNGGKFKQDGKAYNPYSVLHRIKEQIINTFAASFRQRKIDDKAAHKMNDAYQVHVQAWCKATGKDYNEDHKKWSAEWLFKALEERYGWRPEELTINIENI